MVVAVGGCLKKNLNALIDGDVDSYDLLLLYYSTTFLMVPNNYYCTVQYNGGFLPDLRETYSNVVLIVLWKRLFVLNIAAYWYETTMI